MVIFHSYVSLPEGNSKSQEFSHQALDELMSCLKFIWQVLQCCWTRCPQGMQGMCRPQILHIPTPSFSSQTEGKRVNPFHLIYTYVWPLEIGVFKDFYHGGWDWMGLIIVIYILSKNLMIIHINHILVTLSWIIGIIGDKSGWDESY